MRGLDVSLSVMREVTAPGHSGASLSEVWSCTSMPTSGAGSPAPRTGPWGEHPPRLAQQPGEWPNVMQHQVGDDQVEAARVKR